MAGITPIAAAGPAKKTPWWAELYVQVLIAIAAGALIGHFAPATGEALKPLGDAFIKLVKMIIAPVIFLTVTLGIAGMRDIGKVGGVAAKAFGYFITVSSFALVVGLVVANVVQPGAGMNIDPASLDASKVEGYATKSHDMTIVGFLMD
ncbi:MAG: cation:dicarboxylate symporter family transporter, partial [Phenylobacterium sp.]